METITQDGPQLTYPKSYHIFYGTPFILHFPKPEQTDVPQVNVELLIHKTALFLGGSRDENQEEGESVWSDKLEDTVSVRIPLISQHMQQRADIINAFTHIIVDNPPSRGIISATQIKEIINQLNRSENGRWKVCTDSVPSVSELYDKIGEEIFLSKAGLTPPIKIYQSEDSSCNVYVLEGLLPGEIGSEEKTKKTIIEIVDSYLKKINFTEISSDELQKAELFNERLFIPHSRTGLIDKVKIRVLIFKGNIIILGSDQDKTNKFTDLLKSVTDELKLLSYPSLCRVLCCLIQTVNRSNFSTIDVESKSFNESISKHHQQRRLEDCESADRTLSYIRTRIIKSKMGINKLANNWSRLTDEQWDSIDFDSLGYGFLDEIQESLRKFVEATRQSIHARRQLELNRSQSYAAAVTVATLPQVLAIGVYQVFTSTFELVNPLSFYLTSATSLLVSSLLIYHGAKKGLLTFNLDDRQK